MKRGWLILLVPLLTAQSRPAPKPVLVPDVSQRDIEIAYSFTGAELLLFGAILYPGGRLPDDDKPTDIVVVVKGPVQSILVREKEKVSGSTPPGCATARHRVSMPSPRRVRSAS